MALRAKKDLHKKPIDPGQHSVGFNPYANDGIAQGMRNHKLGFVEDAAIHSFMFDEQYNTFHSYGCAADPSAPVADSIVGDLESLKRNDGLSVYNLPQREHKKRKHDLKTAQRE
ncbi:hypothetical protein KI387_000247 [Taxus chinensis]|uniref:Uncharacterized protein n=1 Tax=Taxus chinensis TaxID=29808 RepID=A0AA38GSX0_TAXCH|nr:hypothetical protein KI387_000247 [Taxus chinensis]